MVFSKSSGACCRGLSAALADFNPSEERGLEADVVEVAGPERDELAVGRPVTAVMVLPPTVVMPVTATETGTEAGVLVVAVELASSARSVGAEG